MQRSFEHSYAFYMGAFASAPGVVLAGHVARFILAKGATDLVERRELESRVTAFRNADDGAKAAALRVLEDNGWLIAAQGAYLKARPTHWGVNPKIHHMFAHLAQEERIRREVVVARIAEHRKPRKL